MTPMFKRPGPPPLPDSCYCTKCGAIVKNVEVGLTKKMINRGMTEYMCLTCLAEFTGLSEDELLRKAEQFKRMGCILFN